MTTSPAGPADFERVEKEAQALAARFEAGDLTEDDLKARLKELMIQDGRGRWWMIGYETGRWYVHTEEGWSESEPPLAAAPTAGPAPGAAPGVAPGPAPRVEGTRSRVGAEPRRALSVTDGGPIWLPLLTLIGGGAIAAHFISFFAPFWDGSPSASSFFFGLVFGLVTGFVVRWQLAPLDGKDIAVIALAWALGVGLLSPFRWLHPQLFDFLYWERMGGGYLPFLDATLGGLVTGIVVYRANRNIRWYVVAGGWFGASLVTWLLWLQGTRGYF
jgi:hypothetical protein